MEDNEKILKIDANIFLHEQVKITNICQELTKYCICEKEMMQIMDAVDDIEFYGAIFADENEIADTRKELKEAIKKYEHEGPLCELNRYRQYQREFDEFEKIHNGGDSDE